MVFSSLVFLFVFLPLSVGAYYSLLRWRNGRIAILSLFISSLIYYCYWKLENIWLIIVSILVNYFFGKIIAKQEKQSTRKIFFLLGLFFNLGLLGYFKYTDFVISTINTLANSNISLTGIILPIGISFFTFQQIAYISDIYTKKFQDLGGNFLDYCLFVCFFPQLVAGPIVHHHEMMPQFADDANRKINWENIYTGLIMLSIGLAKKVLIADNLSPLVQYTFDKTSVLSFGEALFGSIAYSLQLYFDFSGYSDMAVGAGLFFNIKLPFNFNSPFKSTSIQDFWHRWHITLSIWLRDYIYFPLGGSRCSKYRTFLNLFLTFLLGGLWHGAAWTYVLWGVCHGSALVVHRIWKQTTSNFVWLGKLKFLWWFFTFSFVVFAFVIFRAKDFNTIYKFASAFKHINNFSLTEQYINATTSAMKLPSFLYVCIMWGVALFIALFFKNSIWLYQHKEKKSIFVFAIVAFLASILCLFFPDNVQEFIYFQF